MREKIEYMIEKKPEKIAKIIEKVYKYNPEIVEEMLEYPEGAEHIPSRKKYEELIAKVKWADGSGRGAKWSFEDIKRNSKINFDHTEFTEYDYAYLVNMLYAKCCKHITDPAIFLKLAKCLLEDDDEETKMYRGAEHYGTKLAKKGIQDYYDHDIDDYDEEDRRVRRKHYRNPRMEEDYRNPRYLKDDRYDSRYRDTNIGFNSYS